MLVLNYKDAKRKIRINNTKIITSTKNENPKPHKQLFSDILSLRLVKKVNFQRQYMEDSLKIFSQGNNISQLVKSFNQNLINYQKMLQNPATALKIQKLKEKKEQHRNSSVIERVNQSFKNHSTAHSSNNNKKGNSNDKVMVTEALQTSNEKDNYLPIIEENYRNYRDWRNQIKNNILKGHKITNITIKEHHQESEQSNLFDSINSTKRRPQHNLNNLLVKMQKSPTPANTNNQKEEDKEKIIPENQNLKRVDVTSVDTKKDKPKNEMITKNEDRTVVASNRNDEIKKTKIEISPGKRRIILNKSPFSKIETKDNKEIKVKTDNISNKIRNHSRLKELIKTNKTFQV